MTGPETPARTGTEAARFPPLESVLEVGWLLAALLVPLWIVVAANQPFEPPKAALLRSLAWLLLGAWVAGHLLRGRAPWPVLARNPLAWPVAGVATAVLLATLLAVDPRLSLLGSYIRSQGLLTWLGYLALFVVVADRLRRLEQARRLAVALVVSAVPLVVLGGFQAAGMDPLGFITDARSPVYATLGRANFLGAYLAMLMPLTAALLLTRSSGPAEASSASTADTPGRARSLLGARGSRGALAALLAGQAFVVGATLVRGAWLAAAVGLVAFLLLWWWRAFTRRARALVAVATGLAAAAVVAGGGISLLQADAGSVAARRTIWLAVWELIRERPVVGYGPEALELVFPRVFPPQLVYYQGREVFVDRAHNLVLDWAVTAGLVGLAAMAYLLVRFFTVALRRWRALDTVASTGSGGAPAVRRTLLVAALAAVAANLAGNLAGFDVTATATASWLLMALAVSPALAPGDGGPSPAGGKAAPDGLPLGRRRQVGAALVGLAVVAAITQANLRPLLADVAHRTALDAAEAGNLDAAGAAAERATTLWPVEPEHHRLLGRVHLIRALEPGGGAATLDRAERAFLAARDLRPLDPRGWIALGRFYHRAGVAFDPGALPWAHQAYARALALSPHTARLHVAWGEVYLSEGRPEVAFERFARAAALDATDVLALTRLGETALALDRPERAVEAFEAAARHEADSILPYLGLARAYQAAGEEERARTTLERARVLDPDHPAIEAVKRGLRVNIDENGPGAEEDG